MVPLTTTSDRRRIFMRYYQVSYKVRKATLARGKYKQSALLSSYPSILLPTSPFSPARLPLKHVARHPTKEKWLHEAPLVSQGGRLTPVRPRRSRVRSQSRLGYPKLPTVTTRDIPKLELILATHWIEIDR